MWQTERQLGNEIHKISYFLNKSSRESAITFHNSELFHAVDIRVVSPDGAGQKYCTVTTLQHGQLLVYSLNKKIPTPITQSFISLMPKGILIWMKEFENIQHKSSSLTHTDLATSILVDYFHGLKRKWSIWKQSIKKTQEKKETYMGCL